MPDDLLTVRQAAEACHVHPQTVRRWIDEGHIASVLVHPTDRVRIPTTEVARILAPRAGGDEPQS